MMRSASPALSEISVGSPSPPPSTIRPISLKRLCDPSPNAEVLPKKAKSFSIAHILGKADDTVSEPPTKPTQEQMSIVLMSPNQSKQPTKPIPWDIARTGPIVSGTITHPLHSFLPPTLLHYDPRLAWDYQRQLQEHFHMQAQLLRQMSMDPGIIPSEDGSERSHSNSTESDSCQSPDVSVVGCQESGSAEKIQQNQNKDNTQKDNTANDTPLDALFQLSTKNFDEDQDPTTLNIFATRTNPKKKRKSRTAFTNHQIFELEKRFLYQKYLSPSDRDEIAGGLGLSNAQVITWFQNRRAKLKRDMEELKKDVESVKQLQDQSADINRQQSTSNSTQLQLLYHPQFLQTQSQLDNNHPQYQQILKNRQEMHLLQQKLQRTEEEICSDHSLNQQHQLMCPMPPTHNVCKSTIAEDKRDLKMLKMMTLMYYSSRCNDSMPIIPHSPHPTAKVNN